MSVLETDIENAVVGWAMQRGIEALKLNLMANRGWPDRLFLFPRHPIFIEFKRPGARPRPLQESRHALLRKLGYDTYCVDSKQAGIKILQRAVLQATGSQRQAATAGKQQGSVGERAYTALRKAGFSKGFASAIAEGTERAAEGGQCEDYCIIAQAARSRPGRGKAKTMDATTAR